MPTLSCQRRREGMIGACASGPLWQGWRTGQKTVPRPAALLLGLKSLADLLSAEFYPAGGLGGQSERGGARYSEGRQR